MFPKWDKNDFRIQLGIISGMVPLIDSGDKLKRAAFAPFKC
jgi:hypothetical protein